MPSVDRRTCQIAIVVARGAGSSTHHQGGLETNSRPICCSASPVPPASTIVSHRTDFERFSVEAGRNAVGILK